MTYRQLLEALSEAQKRKAYEARCAEELLCSPQHFRAAWKVKLQIARVRLDEEIA